MSSPDLTINLYYSGEMDEPVSTIEATYAELAKMDNAEFVGRCKTGFCTAVENRRMVLKINEPNHRVSRAWEPTNVEQEELERELAIQLDHLIREWRA